MKLLETNVRLPVPGSVAKCPYCSGELFVSFSCWTECDDGSWRADGVELDCNSEPELDEERDDDEQREVYDHWLEQHTYMPYVYWLPATVTVEKWVNENYRFKMDEEAPRD